MFWMYVTYDKTMNSCFCHSFVIWKAYLVTRIIFVPFDYVSDGSYENSCRFNGAFFGYVYFLR